MMISKLNNRSADPSFYRFKLTHNMPHWRILTCRQIRRVGPTTKGRAYKETRFTSGPLSGFSFLSLSLFHVLLGLAPITLHASPSPISPIMFGLFKIFLLALALSTAQAAPVHTKRIAQVISVSTKNWEIACVCVCVMIDVGLCSDQARLFFIAHRRRRIEVQLYLRDCIHHPPGHCRTVRTTKCGRLDD
jgi:hypothetical protein